MTLYALLAAFALGASMPADAAPASATADAPERTAQQRLALDIFRELVEIDTVTATGDTAAAADAMAARLLAAGFPPADVQVFKPAPRKGNLVARLRGSGCLLYTSPSPRDGLLSRMPSSA